MSAPAAAKTFAALLALYQASDAAKKAALNPREAERCLVYLTRWTVVLTIACLAAAVPSYVMGAALSLNALTVGLFIGLRPGAAHEPKTFWLEDLLIHGGSACVLCASVACGAVSAPGRPVAAAALAAAVLFVNFLAEKLYEGATSRRLYDTPLNTTAARAVLLPLLGAAVAAFVSGR